MLCDALLEVSLLKNAVITCSYFIFCVTGQRESCGGSGHDACHFWGATSGQGSRQRPEGMPGVVHLTPISAVHMCYLA